MNTAKGTECQGKHDRNGQTDKWAIRAIGNRRYTECAHTIGHTYCGQLIDVTDATTVVICCGEHDETDSPYYSRTNGMPVKAV
jgi:hypothetical protein